MAAACPYCQHRLVLRWPRAGRHEVRCPQCSHAIAVVVPDQAAESWVATPIDSGIEGEPQPVGQWSAVVAAESDLPPRSSLTPYQGDDTPPPLPSVPALPFPVRKRPAGSVPDCFIEDSRPTPPPAHLPGYRIERAIGFGGMGTVFLARQLSLDRPVALKVMSKRWNSDPVFVARFVREAYAAALLSHPNVVQIHDIGEDDGTRFFSMEYVEGRSLADLVKSGGRLDPETAVGYVLQAARGLKHAHDRGMIHRDVKPDNLLVTDNGLVKVADLGLVKTPGTSNTPVPVDLTETGSGLRSLPPDMTGTQMALGTPAYMAPEQCRDAAAVDHRADIYSLGCTLYVLVTGQPPFDGDTAVEVMARQAYQPLVPPDQIAGRVPKELSAVVQKMMAKEPNRRYQSMGEVIRVLEQWLGVQNTGTFSPKDDHINELEDCAREFNSAPAAVLRHRLVTGFVTGCSVAAVVLMFFAKLGWAFGLAGLVVQAAAVYFVLNGAARRTYFFRRVRQFAGHMSVGDWCVVLAGVGLFTALLGVLGLLEIWAGFGLAGVLLAILLRVGPDRAVEHQRAAPLARCERLLRRLRITGLDEEELRLFVAKFAGRHWEEFFEELFGFEAKLATRPVLLRGGRAGHREAFAEWREPILGAIDRVEKGRKEFRERELLERVERARLVATGLGERAARDRAAVVAAAVVGRANEFRVADADPATATPDMPNLRQITGRWTEPHAPGVDEETPSAGWGEWAIAALVGPHVRAVMAALCMAGFLLWVYQNGLFADPKAFAGPDGQAVPMQRVTQPLHVDGLPPTLTAWCDSANVGWAGVLLLASLFYQGNRTGALAIAGAVVTAFAHRYGLPGVEPLRDYHVGMVLGTILTVAGCRLRQM